MNVRKGAGSLSVLPARRTRWVAAIVALWLLLLLALAGWWATLVFQQARRIAELEAQLGQPGSAVIEKWDRTRLMLVGESSFFLLVLLALSAGLAWLYWRENRRARGMQAFFASVTHELRTPLTSIRLQAEAIAEGDQRVDLARRLLEDSHRLESQIDKTLELARIEGGGPLAEQSIPLRAWLDRSLADLGAAHGARLIVHCDIAAALPPVQADVGALQMILRNLLENSVRHAQVSPVIVQLSARAENASVVMEYADNGRGVAGDAQRLGRLFGRGADSGGAGVGLYLVRALMERMDGKAEFHSAPGEGFRATLRFRTAGE